MERPYRLIDVKRSGDVFSVRMRLNPMDEVELVETCNELVRLVQEDGCRKLALLLGPPDPEFLYSIFLAKLVSLQRRLHERGGALRLAGASPATMDIFAACRLDTLFDFAPDEQTAIDQLARLP
jgi:anti-anti-sigma factor